MEAMTEVVASEPETVLILIGATEARGPPQSEAAARLGRTGHLVVLPRQPQESIPRYLAMADILVSPRLYGDNVPLKIFDYMRSGKPIVATDTTGHLAVLSNDIAVLVHRDPASIAAGILRLLANPGLARKLAARARKRALDCHHDEVFGSFVSRVYERILSVDTAPIR
jgi:glycosyltransferase involved in cell wall biosynthesis